MSQDRSEVARGWQASDRPHAYWVDQAEAALAYYFQLPATDCKGHMATARDVDMFRRFAAQTDPQAGGQA